MAKFQMRELVGDDVVTSRFGAGTGSANNWGNGEAGKPVKLVGDSRYDLCAAGDPIQGFVAAVESATVDGYTLGSVQLDGRKTVVLDGLQATPGTGTIAVGDYVVCGTVVAKGTAITLAGPKVCKATNQPGAAVVLADNLVASINAGLVKVAEAQLNGTYAWRVVALLGTDGSVGSSAVIERVAP